MSKIIFRMRFPSMNAVVEVDENTGAVTIHNCSTAFSAREQDQFLGGEGKTVELSELVARAYKKQKVK